MYVQTIIVVGRDDQPEAKLLGQTVRVALDEGTHLVFHDTKHAYQWLHRAQHSIAEAVRDSRTMTVAEADEILDETFDAVRVESVELGGEAA